MNDDLRQNLIYLVSDLISLPSENPPGREAFVEQYIVQYCRKVGLDVERVPVTANRANLIITLPGQDDDDPLTFTGHMDVVPVWPDERLRWLTNPFEPLVKDGWLIGRGSADMKGGLACVLLAMSELKRSGIVPKRTIYLLATCDEEDAMRGSRALLAHPLLEKLNELIVCEPTGMTLCRRSRGRTYGDLTIRGKTAHGSRPGTGVNTINIAAELISRLHNLNASWSPPSGVPQTPPFGLGSTTSPAEMTLGDASAARSASTTFPAEITLGDASSSCSASTTPPAEITLGDASATCSASTTSPAEITLGDASSSCSASTTFPAEITLGDASSLCSASTTSPAKSSLQTSLANTASATFLNESANHVSAVSDTSSYWQPLEIQACVEPGIIPDVCRMRLDCRVSPQSTCDFEIARLEFLLKQIELTYHVKAEFSVCDKREPWETSPDHRIVQQIHSYGAFKETTFAGSTDANILRESGLTPVIIGPGDLSNVHHENERVFLEELFSAYSLYLKLMVD